MEFREILGQLRRERGLNQEQLAEKIGVSRQAVSKWETGEASPDLPNLLSLADALDVSLDALCGREPQAGSAARGNAAPDGAPVEAPKAPAKSRAWKLFLILVAVLIIGRILLILIGLLNYMPLNERLKATTEAVVEEAAPATDNTAEQSPIG